MDQKQISIFAEGQREAERFKWIESEKARRDLGYGAIKKWVHAHWHGYLRVRWMEHLEGKVFWVELDRDDFGLLPARLPNSPLLQPILERLKVGQENLNIIQWALAESLPMDQVMEVLLLIDINSRRLACKFCPET